MKNRTFLPLLFLAIPFVSRNRSASDSVTELEDMDLVERIVQKDQRALAELYQRYGNLVYGLAYRIVATDAEEITQDTFLKVWNQAESWDASKGRFSSWLLTIARYTAIDYIRKENRQPQQAGVLLELIPDEQKPKIGGANWIDGQLMRNLLKELPEDQQQVIELAFFQGLTHSELAEALQLPLGTVKTRLRLGMQKLKQRWLEESEN